MDNVTVRASVAAAGLKKGAEVTVAETPMVRGAIDSGVFELIERHETREAVGARMQDALTRTVSETDETPPPEWNVCPACRAERTDFETPDGKYLPNCPSCGSELAPVRSETPPSVEEPETAADGSTVVSGHLPGTSPRG